MKNKLIKYINEDAIQYGDFILSSGIHSKYFIDMSKVLYNKAAVSLVTTWIAEKYIYDGSITAVGGPALGAAPLVTGILTADDINYPESPLHGFLVKKDGTIEGNLRPKDAVLLVEDVVTTGKQLLKTKQIVEDYGAEVVKIVVVLDRLQGAKYLLNFDSLVTIEDLDVKI